MRERKYCTAYAIDTDKLNARWRDYLRAVYDLHPADEGEQGVIRDGEFVAVQVSGDSPLDQPTWALVGTEGVGWVPDEYNLINIRFATGYGNQARLPIYLCAVGDLLTGRTINLADHIRTFGDRLESNFWLWYKRATPDSKRLDLDSIA